MKNLFTQLRRTALTGLALAASVGAAQAATDLITSFPNAGSVAGWSQQNWNGSVGIISWSANDAQGSASSGSMELQTDFNATTNGCAYMLGAGDLNATGYTALEYDVKVDPASPQDQYGTAADFKVGVQTGGGYVFYAADLNISRVTTNNGWQHVVVPASSLGGATWGDIKTITIQEYDNNYTNAGLTTNIMYVDNIQFTGPSATYPNYTAFTFDTSNSVGTNNAFTNWYGHSEFITWTTNDASNSPSSGSMEMIGQLTEGDNNFASGVWFDTNAVNDGGFFTTDSNSINGTHYTAIEFDVLWDTNLSTVSIDSFNSLGDVNGMPIGLMSGPNGVNTGVEAMGTGSLPIPDAATNGWVHMKIPINDTSAGIQDTVGLFFKKYNFTGSGVDGTAAFFIDNVVFDGGPVSIPQPTIAITQPLRGLHLLNASGGLYDRESLETFFANYDFVDQGTPMSYNMNISSFPDKNHGGYVARLYLVPNGAATEPEPDWNEPALVLFEIARNANNTATCVFRCKTNSPTSNGDLYNGSNSTFTSSTIIGPWSFTFLNNTTCKVVAPDGTSSNMFFPLGLSSSDVSTLYSDGGAMVVYFGSMNGGANVGQYMTYSSVSITQGATTLLSDNFATDAALDINNGGGSSSIWAYASDSGTAASDIFLLAPTTKYYVDWSVPANNFLLETNNVLDGSGAWSTNTGTTATQMGDHFHTEFGTTNLPAGGNVYFRVMHPGLTD